MARRIKKSRKGVRITKKKVIRPHHWVWMIIFGVALTAGIIYYNTTFARAQTSIFQVYMSSTGNDANDGLNTDSPVKTLGRAEAIIKAKNPNTDVEVRIEQGTYVAGQTNWNYYIPGHTISFMPEDYEYGESVSGIAGLPVFRGNGTKATWFYFNPANRDISADTGLRFYYLKVERYSNNGIVIYGGYETNSKGYNVPKGTGANRNTFYGMVFQYIGSKHNAAGFGYAGLVLSNSSYNSVRNNHFKYLENKSPNNGLIHGTYTQHGSKYNTISSNNFYYISGGPAWFRNDANNNIVTGNRFEKTSDLTYYGEWFCDKATTCAKLPNNPQECASHGNRFYSNQMISSYNGAKIATYHFSPPGMTYKGGSLCNNEGQNRVYLSAPPATPTPTPTLPTAPAKPNPFIN